MMSTEQENPMSIEFLENSLHRLRKRMTYVQDEMDITAFAIKAIENDIQKINTEDLEANEKDA
jgi:hypothetical protein